ncbi:MAG: hypothetical protein ACUVQ8_08580 [Nitrososphaeria archaeon]
MADVNVAFLRGYTLKSGDSMATDMIGYGATIPDVIVEEMRKKDVEVVDIVPSIEDTNSTSAKLKWVYGRPLQPNHLLLLHTSGLSLRVHLYARRRWMKRVIS